MSEFKEMNKEQITTRLKWVASIVEAQAGIFGGLILALAMIPGPFDELVAGVVGMTAFGAFKLYQRSFKDHRDELIERIETLYAVGSMDEPEYKQALSNLDIITTPSAETAN